MPPNQSEMFILLTKVSEDITEVKVEVAGIKSNQEAQDAQLLKIAKKVDRVDREHLTTRERQDETRRSNVPGSKTDVVMVVWARKMFLLTMVGLIATIAVSLGTVIWQYKNAKIATVSRSTSTSTAPPANTP